MSQAQCPSRRPAGFCLVFLASLLLASPASLWAAREGPSKAALIHFTPHNRFEQDFPFQNACISAKFPAKNVALKGIAIKLGQNANVLFDPDLLRMSAGWTGNFITTHGAVFDGAHGSHPAIDGDQKFGNPMVAGWAGADGNFSDPRVGEPFGPVPTSFGRWDGLYVSGDTVTLSYTIRGAKIHEQPSALAPNGTNGPIAFVRTFEIKKTPESLSLLVCEVPGATGQAEDANRVRLTATSGIVTLVGVRQLPKNAKLALEGNRAILHLAKGTSGIFNVVLWNGQPDGAASFSTFLDAGVQLVAFEKGGPAHWTETVATRGELAKSSTPDGSYVLDKLSAPENNPWKRQVRFGGMDFFPDGKRAALCTWDGDIWIVSGIDDKLEHLVWKRFSSGMYETLGLKIVNDVIYTSGRDQITRYHDLNGDGEADYYENFNNQYMSSEGFHEFVFDLQTDKGGNFYFAKANPVNGGGHGFGDNARSPGNGTVSSHSGCLFKLSKDGRTLEILARGLRAPNGIGVRNDGQVTTSDNEGTWVPATPINWVRPDDFLGVSNRLTTAELAGKWHPPICWLAHNGPDNFDNSGGGQVWVTSDKWGPYKNELFHFSYGKCRLFHVMKETLPDGTIQAGVVQIPVKFTSSVMRGHFNPQDGQLYIAGLRGWQTDAANLTGFDRVRYTGKPVHAVEQLHVKKGAVTLTFSEPLDPVSAADLQNYTVKRWNYERAEHYGSPEFQVANPQLRGREIVAINSAALSDDGKTVTLAIPDLQPVMQESIKYSLKAKDGQEINQEIEHTIHVIP